MAIYELHDIPGGYRLVFEVSTSGKGTTFSDEVVGVLPFDAVVDTVVVVFDSNLTGDPANYFTLTLKERGANSQLGSNLTLAEKAFDGGVFHAWQEVQLTLNSTNTENPLRADTVLTMEKSESGTGLAMPDLVGYVDVHGGGSPPTTSTSTSTTSSSTSTTSSSTSTSTTTTTSTSTSSSTTSSSTSTTTTTSTSTSSSTTSSSTTTTL